MKFNTEIDGKPYTGEIDEVRIWNRYLTTKEVWQLYLSGMGKLTLFERFLAWLFPRQYTLLVERRKVK